MSNVKSVSLYAHEIERITSLGDVLLVRPIEFPNHVPDREYIEITSIDMDGGGKWFAWSPHPVGDEMTKKLYQDASGFPCPYGMVGDLIVVGEMPSLKPVSEVPPPSIKITAKITAVSTKRVLSLTERETLHTGVPSSSVGLGYTFGRYHEHRTDFEFWWQVFGYVDLNLSDNPWVWLVTVEEMA